MFVYKKRKIIILIEIIGITFSRKIMQNFQIKRNTESRKNKLTNKKYISENNQNNFYKKKLTF